MRQRVAIAIALLHQPDLLIADEPTTALDVTIQAQILAEVQKLARDHGTALIWITHDLSVIAGLADEIAVMYAGRIVETGAADAVLDRPAASLYARPDRQRAQPQPARREAAADSRHDAEPAQPAAGLRVPHPLPARRCRLRTGTGTVAAGAGPDDALLSSAARRCRHDCRADHRTARRLEALRPDLRRSRSPRALASRADLARRRRTRWCRRSTTSISPSARGEVVGLVGESGCGKSTLGRMVAGIMPPIGRHRSCSRATTSPRCRRTARAMRS